MSALPTPLARCAACGMIYNPALTAAACPHASRIETALLKRLREAGPPYGDQPLFEWRGDPPVATCPLHPDGINSDCAGCQAAGRAMHVLVLRLRDKLADSQ
jgi:hypothetical protein